MEQNLNQERRYTLNITRKKGKWFSFSTFGTISIQLNVEVHPQASPTERIVLLHNPLVSSFMNLRKKKSPVFLVLCVFCLHQYIQYFSKHQNKPLACRNPGSNQGPLDLQSNALPTELFRLRPQAFKIMCNGFILCPFSHYLLRICLINITIST